MKGNDFDWNLIKTLEALFRHRNVSSAAKELGQSQSAVSHALARARDHFGDPLFVRVPKGMVVTRFGETLEAEVLSLFRAAQSLGSRKERFEPSTACGRIVIAATEYYEIISMPRIVARLEKEAPRLQVSLRPVGSSLPKAELESGAVHCAIAGFFKDVPEGYFQAALCSDGFSTVVRRGHPSLRDGTLLRADFLRHRHALITLQGDFQEVLSDEDAGEGRTFSYGTASFTSVAWIVEKTDLILTAPSRLVAAFQGHFDLHAFPCPFALPPIRVRMIWHSRTDADPLYAWFRGVVRETCAKDVD